MGVIKARSVDQLPGLADGDLRGRRGFELALTLSRTCARMRPRPFPPGVHRSRSRDEAARLRATWERD